MRSGEAALSSAPIEPLHGLVVEDNPTNQFVVAQFLRKLGVTYDMAARGCEAISAVAIRRFDFILMDIEMPVLDGYDTTRELRRIEMLLGRPRTPVIGLSADVLPGSQRRAEEAGMDDFLTKPLIMPALHAALDAATGRLPGCPPNPLEYWLGTSDH